MLYFYRAVLLSSLSLLFTTGRVIAEIEVYRNDVDQQFTTSIGFGGDITLWDDLQLTQGGILSSISFIAQPPSGSTDQTASGVIDLRLFDETFNRPQGDPLATIPFSGTFDIDPSDFFDRRLVIEVTDLESQNILLPTVGRIGAGISFDNTGWFFPDADAPEIGSSPGGNWLDNSFFERNDVDGLPWSVSIAEPQNLGPGVGTYHVIETAKPTQTSGSYSGGGIDSGFFRGTTFEIVRPTKLTQVGGWIGGTGTIFAAIVDLGSSQFNAPNPPDLSGNDVVATTLIELDGDPFSGKDVFGDIDVTLQPGNYALYFGGGKFGADADADGLMRYEHIPNGTWPTLSIRQSDFLTFGSTAHSRIYAIAESAPGTIQIRPSFDVEAEVIRNDFSGDVESVRLIDGESLIYVDQPEEASEPNQVPVMEFSLENVPEDRDILTATLELDLFFSNSGTQFDVYGYAGDGAATIGDAAGHLDIVGTTNISGTGVVTINLDPTFIQGLVGNASHFGLIIEPDAIGAFGFGTLEGGQFYDAPLLTLGLSEAPQTGDFDLDGDVDGQDFLAWQRGESADPLSTTDLDVWRTNFAGAGALEQSPQTSAVPEPRSLALSLTFIVAIAIRRTTHT